MKVLFVALDIFDSVGGMERFNQRVVRCVRSLQGSLIDDACIISLRGSPYSAPEDTDIRYVGCSRSKVKVIAVFVKEVRRLQPDVVLYGHVMLAPLAALARVLSRSARNVLFVHGIEVWGDTTFRSAPRWEPAVIRALIDQVISVSRFTAARMSRAYGIQESRFAILPNAVDIGPEDAAFLATRFEGATSVNLLTVARMSEKDWYKGCDKVIRAMPMVLAKCPNVYYHIVGEGPLRKEYQKLAASLGVEHHVRFLGRLDDDALEAAYRMSHIFVMPSIGEGFGIVFLEAWKHGLPVVAGNRDAAAELIDHGENGLLVDPDSVEQIAEAIIWLASDRNARERLGMRGWETVRQHYSHERFCENLRVILETLRR